MKKEELEQDIKKRNLDINFMIEKVIENMKNSGIKTIGRNDSEVYINQPAKRILEMEMKKCFEIYGAEFVYLIDSEKENLLNNAAIFANNGLEADANGFLEGISFSAGTQNFFEEQNPNAKYSVDESGRVTFNKEGIPLEKKKVKLIGKKGELHILEDDESIENKMTVRDYLSYAFMNDIQDIDFFLGTLPHESMHVFGFNGGIFEGVTETFTREIARKYGIRTLAIAHNDETKVIQKVERIIGRRKLAVDSFDKNKRGNVNVTSISSAIDEQVSPDENSKDLFMKHYTSESELIKVTKKNRNDETIPELREKRNELFVSLNKELDNYIMNNPDLLYDLGVDETELSENEQQLQITKLKRIVEIQDQEIETLTQIIGAFEEVSKQKKLESNDDICI